MPEIDYTGPHGGALAAAFGAGVMFSGALLMAAGRWIWRTFFEPRIAELKRQMAEEREECARRLAVQDRRIAQLEMLLATYGTGPLRQAVQTAISEQRVESDAKAGHA